MVEYGTPADRLKALVYIGYDEPEIVKAFLKDTGIHIETKTCFGGDEMMSLLRDKAADYDLVVVDPEYTKKLVDSQLIRPLSESDYDFSQYNDRFKHFNDFYVGTNCTR